MIREWLAHMKCPSCKSNGLEYKESRSVTCPVCGWTTVADWNYVDMLGARGEYETLAEAYADLFERMERGQFGDSKCCYSKTQEEEFAEFLDEARLSIDQLMGLRILDAGCGAARLTRMLSICGAECVALDIHQRLYIYAKQNHQPSNERSPLYVRGSVEHVPFEPCFDVVWCQGVLSYVPDPIRAIREMQRVVKADGLLYVWIYHSLAKSPILRLGRALRNLPSMVRNPVYDSLAFCLDCEISVRQAIKGTRSKSKTQTRLHLRDWSIADNINILSLGKVLQLFDKAHWEIVWSTDEGTVVRCLLRKTSSN
jgi:SAM-dependent methyltransferase